MQHVEVEITNHCNTHCIYCPRGKMPALGYMDPKIFPTIVQRVKEFEEQFQKPAGIYLCGHGEPLMHPNIIDFISFLSKNGIFSFMNTNGFLLDSKLSKSLINAGLNEIAFSVSGINDVYKKIHKFDFEIIEKNILSFLKYSKNKCNVIISIVKCEYNITSIDQIMEYWRHKGLGNHQFLIFEQTNRGGAHDNRKSFINSNMQMEETKQLLKDRNIILQCFAPFMDVSIGWDGLYYLCINDFQKEFPLGSVETKSFAELHSINVDYYNKGLSICKNCDTNPFNIIRSILIDIKNNEKGMSDLEAALEHAKSDSHLIYGDY